MSARATPDDGLTTEPTAVSKQWAVGMGERTIREWTGKREDVLAEYENQKSIAEATSAIEQLDYRSAEGRTRLVVSYARNKNIFALFSPDVTVLEELYAIDLVKDIAEAPYYTLGGAGALTDEQVAIIRDVSDRNLTEAGIDKYVLDNAIASTYLWASWTNPMKSLRYHYIHGAGSYLETGFVFRRTEHGVRTSRVKANFTGINTVDSTDPDFSTQMSDLVTGLPAGEWLIRPIGLEHTGKGRWRVTKEWQWALKWSIVYGGTWNVA